MYKKPFRNKVIVPLVSISIIAIVLCSLLMLSRPCAKEFMFSCASGIYTDEFNLEIIAPSEEIYYTLDGSLPNRDSLRYTKPIKIDENGPRGGGTTTQG